MPASFRSPSCCEPGPSMTEPGPRTDRDFGVRHRWLLALAIPASPSSAWPCLGWALTAPGAERPHPPQPHPPQVAPSAKLLSGVSVCHCGLLQTLLPCQEGRGDRPGVPSGQGLLPPSELWRGTKELCHCPQTSFCPTKVVPLAG